ncbi:MAG: hypothetical protein EKK68_04670 [Candidatus Competibacteraceae bacterium]|nr:MAG: hypothetical protein EKK68_04670 [Candidatus Competibacteraceae bacterium]
MSAPHYRHTQFGTVIVLALILAAGFTVGMEVLTGVAPLAVIGVALMGVFLALFFSLTVEIDATHLTFRFGIGLIRQRIPLAEIVAVKPVRNTWLYGWGIHCTPHGWLYNVSGWEAIEITLVTGKRFRLGTDEPQRLARMLQAVTKRR